eukprot:155481_1
MSILSQLQTSFSHISKSLMATLPTPMETFESKSQFAVYSEITLSKLYENINNNDDLFLSSWRMNLLTIVRQYLWFCVAIHSKILLYKLNITPSNLKPQAMYDQHQHLLPAPIFSKYNHNPIGYCIHKTTINHIHSLQHATHSLLLSCTKRGIISIFDCHSIAQSIKHCTAHFEPCMMIDNTQFIPNEPSQHLIDYSVWSLATIHAINNTFLLAFGSNTHYVRVFKIHHNQPSFQWSTSALMHGLHANNVPGVAFSTDARYIATVCIDGMLRIWRNHDYNEDHMSRIISDQRPVCSYNEFGKGFKMKSTQCLWSVVWIDGDSIKANNETDSKAKSSFKMKKLSQIGNKVSSFKKRFKLHKSSDAKKTDSPYTNIINFDPSIDDHLPQTSDCKYDTVDVSDAYQKMNNVDAYWMIVCSETDLYVVQMNVANLGSIDEEYSMKEALCVRHVYANYMNESHASDRLQFVRYFPEFSMIICASSGHPCVAILLLCKDKTSGKLSHQHLGFYPQNWSELNFECKNALFIAGMEVIPIENVNNESQIDFYRIVLLYHSGLICVVNVQSKMNSGNCQLLL